MFVFVARFVSSFELKTDNRKTHKNACVTENPPFSQKYDKSCAKATNFSFACFSFVWHNNAVMFLFMRNIQIMSQKGDELWKNF